MKRSVMNRVGKQGRLNAKADKASKKELERKNIDYCQCCGRTLGLGRSHSNKRRYENELTDIALLCNFPCHNFIEYALTPDQRKAVNNFIMRSDLEGEYKFNAMLELLPKEKADEMREKILNYKG